MIRAVQSQANPFPYGWRYVKRPRPDGGIDFDQVPLTLEDALHPQEDDVMPQNTPHDRDRLYLHEVLQSRTAHDPTALVLSDVIIVWNVPGLRQHSPDLSVIFGVRDPAAERTSFRVAEEGVRPTLLIEIVSPDYRRNDVETKVDHYYRAGVPYYVIVDREQVEGPVRLVGYQQGPARYEPMELNDQGRLWVEPVRIWLGTSDNRVVCYDPDSGEEIGDYVQVCRELAAAETKIVEAEAKVVEAEAKVVEAQARAEAEAKARARAEARIQELEERLRRLPGNGGSQE